MQFALRIIGNLPAENRQELLAVLHSKFKAHPHLEMHGHVTNEKNVIICTVHDADEGDVDPAIQSLGNGQGILMLVALEIAKYTHDELKKVRVQDAANLRRHVTIGVGYGA